MEVAQFLKRLAITESNDDPEAWGDGGLAMGRWQVHPVWLWEKARRYGVTPGIDESWNSFAARVITAFYLDELHHIMPLAIAMYFHLGHVADPSSPDWDTDYADRFNEA